jgi:glycine/D-amino acid oxidase-like deaminating enzyme
MNGPSVGLATTWISISCIGAVTALAHSIPVRTGAAGRGQRHLASVRTGVPRREAVSEFEPGGVCAAILGALYRPGAIARHDAVAWAYARAASALGVEIHTQTEVTDVVTKNGRAVGVETRAGTISCGRVLQAVAGMSSVVAKMAGLKLPIRSIPLQACVTEPVKPFLDPIIVSGSLHVYASQVGPGRTCRWFRGSVSALFNEVDARIQEKN